MRHGLIQLPPAEASWKHTLSVCPAGRSDGGHLVITWAPADVPTIEANAYCDGRAAVLAAVDTGSAECGSGR